MTKEARVPFPLSTAGTMLASIIWGALVYAQPSPQALPNMAQQITPLAPQNSRFEPLNPDLADNPSWLASHAVSTVVSPDHKTLVVPPSSAIY